MDDVSLSSAGRLFQMTAADTANALVPITVLVRRTDSFMVSAERRWRRPATVKTKMQSSAKYDEARTWRHLKTTMAIVAKLGHSEQKQHTTSGTAKHFGHLLDGRSDEWESQGDNCSYTSWKIIRFRRLSWLGIFYARPAAGSQDKPSKGNQRVSQTARSFRTELERSHGQWPEETWHQLKRGSRGSGGQREMENSCRPVRLRCGLNQGRRSEWVGFNIPINTLQIIFVFIYSQSLALGTNKQSRNIGRKMSNAKKNRKKSKLAVVKTIQKHAKHTKSEPKTTSHT